MNPVALGKGREIELSIVIPVYRSAGTLRPLVARLLNVLPGITNAFEIIFVNDGSPDNSWGVLEELQASHPDRVVAIELMRNYGQHNALMCGFRHARGAFVVTMDDDLQNPPEEIPKLVEAIKARNLDVVYGGYGIKKHAPWRNLGSNTVNLFYRIVLGSPVKLTSFRIIRRELLESIFSYRLNFTFVDGLLTWNTQRIGQVSVEHHARAEGRSGYSMRKLAALAINLFTNFSLIPLQAVSALGMFSAACGFLLSAYYLLKYLTSNITVSGYASIIIAVLVLGGLQLMAMGVMGEYLGRLHLNMNRKPQYTKRRVLGGATEIDTSADDSDEVSPPVLRRFDNNRMRKAG